MMGHHLFREFFRIDGGFIVNRLSVRLFGPEMAIFLADLSSYEARFCNNEDGWFTALKQERSVNLGIPEKTLTRLMQEATEMEIVQTRMAGVPAKQFIRINHRMIQHLLTNFMAEHSLDSSMPHHGTASQPYHGTASQPSPGNPLYKVEEIRRNKEEKEITRIRTKKPVRLPTPKEIFQLWNETVEGTPLRPLSMLTSKRTDKIKTRLNEHPSIDTWRKAFHKITNSMFMCGENDRHWMCDFDWLLDNDYRMVSVLEGKYDNKGDAKRTNGKGRELSPPSDAIIKSMRRAWDNRHVQGIPSHLKPYIEQYGEYL